VAKVHLSGWGWIGIIASVIWFFLFGGYLFVTWSLELQESSQRALDMCYRALTFELQSDELRGGQSGLKNCIAEADRSKIGAENLLSLLLLNIGTIFFGWIAVMSAISVTRWIKKDL